MGPNGIKIYSKEITLPKDPSVCKPLYLLRLKPKEEIFKLINKGETPLFAQLKNDLQKDKLFIGLLEYPFEGINPKQLNEYNSQVNYQVKKMIFQKLDYFSEQKNLFFKETNAIEKEIMEKINGVKSQIEEFCAERLHQERKAYFKVVIKRKGDILVGGLAISQDVWLLGMGPEIN
jgi:hypothetical protein